MACDHLKHSDSQRPEIDSFVVASSEVNFWSLIVVSADHGQHVSAHSSLVSLFADAEVDDLHCLTERAIQYIFGLYISVAYIPIMQILQRFHKLFHNILQLLLCLDGGLAEAGLVKALHDEEGAVLAEVEVKRTVLDDGRMLEFFEVDEVPFEVEDVLLLELDLLGRVDPARFQMLAPVDACVGSLA